MEISQISPEIVRLLSRIDACQTVVRQRTEFVVRLEKNIARQPGRQRELKKQRHILARHAAIVAQDCAELAALGWLVPTYAMPPVFNGRGLWNPQDVDISLWNDFRTARLDIEKQPA